MLSKIQIADIRQNVFRNLSSLIVCISTILLIASLLFAPYLRQCEYGAKILVGLWALLPPIWFLWEWIDHPDGCKTGTLQQQEALKHRQSLARSIWAAVVIVLANLSGIKWG
jgi:hypothetical protein